jgi:uncharacterized protein (DUF1330 family)
MAAYLIADIEVTDRDGYEIYRRGVAETIAAFGGRFLVRGGESELLEEAAWSPNRLVILEFPSMAKLREWYRSPQYRPLITARQRASRGTLVAVEGVPPA